LNRFSIFPESGQTHRLGYPFLCFVSFGQAKEMKAHIHKKIILKVRCFILLFRKFEFGLNKKGGSLEPPFFIINESIILI